MPRSGPRRPPVVVRLSPAGIAKVDELAAEAGVNRSGMIRTLLTEAILARDLKAARRR